MHTLTRYSKLVLIAFSITCSCFFLFLQDRSPIFFLDNTYSKLVDENTLAYQGSTMKVGSSTDDSINESSSIWTIIGEQLKLDHASQDPRVQAEMRKILAHKKSFETILSRSTPYIYYIDTQIQRRHLPAELALIPIIESEYNPNDHNSIGANGLWQLMPGTARGLGLKVSHGDDDRRNVIDSTNAALTFFNYLGKEFKGNWNLAFAAYNCGPGCVSSAVKRAKSTNYFKLGLPLETKLYVPRLLAISVIIKHAKKYGIVLPQIKDTPFFTEVKVKKSENLSSYSKSTGTDLALLKKLNPDYSDKNADSNTFLVPVSSRAI